MRLMFCLQSRLRESASLSKNGYSKPPRSRLRPPPVGTDVSLSLLRRFHDMVYCLYSYPRSTLPPNVTARCFQSRLGHIIGPVRSAKARVNFPVPRLSVDLGTAHWCALALENRSQGFHPPVRAMPVVSVVSLSTADETAADLPPSVVILVAVLDAFFRSHQGSPQRCAPACHTSCSSR